MCYSAMVEADSRSLHDLEHRTLAEGEKEQNEVLHFNPKPANPMFVACLWSRWEAAGEPTLESFAAITDEPPPEVAAAGHDRCIVPLKPERILDWLSPQGRSKDELYAMLDERDRPYYEHRLAA